MRLTFKEIINFLYIIDYKILFYFILTFILYSINSMIKEPLSCVTFSKKKRLMDVNLESLTTIKYRIINCYKRFPYFLLSLSFTDRLSSLINIFLQFQI